jgi:hypothetical protein
VEGPRPGLTLPEAVQSDDPCNKIMDGTNGSGTAALDGVRWQQNPRRRGEHFESVTRSIRRGAYLWLGIWTIVSAVILACVLTFDHPTALLIREQVGPSRILSLLVHVPEFMAGIAIGATAPLGLWHAVAGRLQGRWRTALLIGLYQVPLIMTCMPSRAVRWT